MRTAVLITVGGVLLLYWVAGPEANPSRGSRLLDSFLVVAPIVALLRVTLRIRRRTQIEGGSAIDAAGVQPGETATLPSVRAKAGPEPLTPRCLEIEAMIASATSDPDFFATDVRPYLIRTTDSSSWSNINLSRKATWSIGKRHTQHANRVKIRDHLDQLKPRNP